MRPWPTLEHIAFSVFYLGTHQPGWLRQTDIPLFVSRRRLERVKRLPRAKGLWALDSGAFTELSLYGRWMMTAEQYVGEVRRYVQEIGNLAWAAPMDWVCEPWVVEKTGLSVEEHQRRTLANYFDLRLRAPEISWVPVLQGHTIRDYWRHANAYQRAGVDLPSMPLVGIGSVCRRQRTAGITVLLAGLAGAGLRLHCFGMSVPGLRRSAGYIVSADSLAWSLAARKRPPLLECRGRHLHCNNCIGYALRWRERLLRAVDLDDLRAGSPPPQPRLFSG